MTVEFTLPDMTCGHCVKAVTAAVLRVDPAARVTVDLSSHQVRIESSRSAQDFSAALADEGYPPVP
jgi:copper chaperone